jgi:hypothetical protein
MASRCRVADGAPNGRTRKNVQGQTVLFGRPQGPRASDEKMKTGDYRYRASFLTPGRLGKLTYQIQSIVLSCLTAGKTKLDVSVHACGEIEHLQKENSELKDLMRRALRLSREHRDFDLWGMKPFVDAIETNQEGNADD